MATPRAKTVDATNASAVMARYVRLVATSEVNGNPWTSVAELNVLDSTGTPIPQTGWAASADSQELVGEYAPVTNAIDGNPSTYWHTQWYAANPPPPHMLTVDMGLPQSISGFEYLPRQAGENGRIAGWNFYTSTDGINWTLASQGVFTNNPAQVTVALAAAATPQDHVPVLNAVANRTDTVGQAVSQPLVATDIDGNALSYSATGLPTGIAINATTGLMSGTPTAVGTFNVAASVNDGHGGINIVTFVWTIGLNTSVNNTVQARYVRLVATSEVNGNPWTSVAEFNVLDSTGAPIPRSGWAVSADSQELVGEYAPVTNAIDGDPNTYWHTQWLTASPPPPHTLTVDMGTSQSISGFTYLPRQTGENGRIAGWNFYTSTDGNTWTLATQGVWTNSPAEMTVALAAASTSASPAPSPNPTRAARIAAFASGPLVAGTPWTATTPVTSDSVLRIGSGQHLVYTAAGVTGSTEPVLGGTVLDGRPIADGTATAYVNGRVLAATQTGAPIVGSAANATAAGLIETDFAAGNFLPPLISTVEGCKSISNGTSFIGHYCFANGTASASGNSTAYAAGPYGAGLSPDFSYHSNTWAEEFVVTDQYFGLVFANSNSPVDIEIDGVQVQAGPTISTGVEGWTLTFNYGGVVKNRTIRVVSAAGSIAPTLRGIALSPQGSIAVGVTSADQILILGDSINATVTPISESGAQMMSYWIQRYLGFGGVINMAVGGSGYISQNPNTFNVPTLLANSVNQTLIASYAPNITHVIVGAGFNDRFLPVATVQAAALGTWKALRAMLPNAKISILDGWSGSSGPDANALALAAGLTSAFATWADPNSRMIHPIGTSVSTAYVSGTGNAGLPITTGNSSVYTSTDAVHPSPAGARYIAQRLSTDINSAWGGAY